MSSQAFSLFSIADIFCFSVGDISLFLMCRGSWGRSPADQQMRSRACTDRSRRWKRRRKGAPFSELHLHETSLSTFTLSLLRPIPARGLESTTPALSQGCQRQRGLEEEEEELASVPFFPLRVRAFIRFHAICIDPPRSLLAAGSGWVRATRACMLCG
jgi:hypothetical protein